MVHRSWRWPADALESCAPERPPTSTRARPRSSNWSRRSRKVWTSCRRWSPASRRNASDRLPRWRVRSRRWPMVRRGCRRKHRIWSRPFEHRRCADSGANCSCGGSSNSRAWSGTATSPSRPRWRRRTDGCAPICWCTFRVARRSWSIRRSPCRRTSTPSKPPTKPPGTRISFAMPSNCAPISINCPPSPTGINSPRPPTL